MTIPNFKNKEDCDAFVKMFDDRLSVKVAMLNTVKERLFPGLKWVSLPAATLETINDITQSLLYDVEMDFEEKYPEYKRDDELFIPRRTFKEDVTEALLEANQKFWNSANESSVVDPLDPQPSEIQEQG